MPAIVCGVGIMYFGNFYLYMFLAQENGHYLAHKYKTAAPSLTLININTRFTSS